MSEPLRHERRFALLGALVTVAEAAAVGGPLAVFFRYNTFGAPERVLLARAAPVVLFAAWLIWWLALRWWRAPLDRAVRRRRKGAPVDGETLALAAAVTLSLPRRAALLRAAMGVVAALGLAILIVVRAGVPSREVLPIVAFTALHSISVEIFRGLAWTRHLLRVRAALLPDDDPVLLFRATYRRRLFSAGLATAVLGASVIALFVMVFMQPKLGAFLKLEVVSPLVIAPLVGVWLLTVRALSAPIQRYLDAQVARQPADTREHPRRDDPRALAAFRAAQRLPYQLGAAKLAIAVAAEVLLASLAARVFGVERVTAIPVFSEAIIVTVGAALYDVLWHRATLRPLLAHLATRHRPAPDEVRAPMGLRGRMLLFLAVLTLFAGGLSLLASFARWGLGGSIQSHGPMLLFFFALLLVASMGIIVLVAADLTEPIRRLEERAAAMAKGELGRPVIHVAGEVDEVGRLTLAFEEMRRALNEKLRSSTEINLSLEAEVSRRTAELSRRNRELRDALDALRRTQAELVRSEKMASMGRLVAGIAHEINNPVNAVVNTVGPLEGAIEDMIAEGPRPGHAALADDAREMIRVIRSGARRTKEIVQALHNYSRGDDDTLAPVDLHRGLDESLDLLRHHLKRGIRVERRYGEVGPMRGHAGQLQQVFMNLLTNAAQAIGDRPGGGTITIATARDGDRVVIRVGDDGPGIPEELQPRIFDPFFTTKDVGEGSGLGLSIVHGIVERHGGTIAVESQPGHGTTFTVTLPAAATPGSPPSPSPSSSAPPSAPPAPAARAARRTTGSG